MSISLTDTKNFIQLNLPQYPNTVELDDTITTQERLQAAHKIVKFIYPQSFSMEEQLIKHIANLPPDLIDYASSVYVTSPITDGGSSNVYRCISFILFGNEKFWGSIKAAVVNQMHIKCDIFDPLCKRFGEVSVSEYTAKEISSHEIDLRAIAHFFNLSIYIFSSSTLLEGRWPKKIHPQSAISQKKIKGKFNVPRYAFYLHKNENPDFFQPVIRFSKEYSFRDNTLRMRISKDTCSENQKYCVDTVTTSKPQSGIGEFINETERNSLVNAIWRGEQYFGELRDRRPEVECNSLTFETTDVIEDGNSFYRAISYLITGNENFHENVRFALVQYMFDQNNWGILNKVCFPSAKSDVMTYLKSSGTQSSGTEAQNVEVGALSLMFGCTIYVFKSGNLDTPVEFKPLQPTVEGVLPLYREKGHYQPVVKYNRSLKHTYKKRTVVSKTPYTPMQTEATIDIFRDIIPNVVDDIQDESFINQLCNELNPDPVDFLLGINDEELPSVSHCNTDLLEQMLQLEKEFEKKTVQKESRKYTFAENMSDNRDNYTVIVPCISDSPEKNLNNAVKVVFRSTEKQCLTGNEISSKHDLLSVKNFPQLVQALNKKFGSSAPIPQRILNHFKRVCRDARLADLMVSTLDNEKADEHRIEVIDMRLRLKPFDANFTSKQCGEVYHGKLKFACLALPTNIKALKNDFAYYYTGGKAGDWVPIPVNAEVFNFSIHQNIKPTTAIVFEGELYVVANNELCVLNLFQDEQKSISMPIPGQSCPDVILAKSNLGNIYLLNISKKQCCRVHKTMPMSWEPILDLQHLNIPRTNSVQFTIKTAENTEIVIVSNGTASGKYVLTDLYNPANSYIPQTNEYVLTFNDGKSRTNITQIQMGFTQVKLPNFDEFEDTKYVLVDIETINNIQNSIKDHR